MAKKCEKSYVSRSVYQKVCEENKRLNADIYRMVMKPLYPETIKMKQRWRDKFEQDALLNQALYEHAKQYIKDNPDSVAAKIAREFQLEQNNNQKG